MHILITGASGFLGRNLCTELETKNKFKLTKLDSQNCDLTKKDNLLKYNKIKYDYIFHLAAWIEGGEFSKKNEGKILKINNLINNNILEWIINNQPQSKIITIGSSGAYDPNLELKEENYLKGFPHKSLSEYGLSKRELYRRLININEKFNIKYLHFIPTTIYGPNYHTDRKNMQFIYDIIKKILLGKNKNADVVLWGNGFQKRQLLFIKDFVNIILNTFKIKENTSYNICPKDYYTIKQYAKIISKSIGFDHNKIIYDKDKFVGVNERILSNNKFLLDHPKYNFTNIQKGLQETIEWSENYFF